MSLEIPLYGDEYSVFDEIDMFGAESDSESDSDSQPSKKNHTNSFRRFYIVSSRTYRKKSSRRF